MDRQGELSKIEALINAIEAKHTDLADQIKETKNHESLLGLNKEYQEKIDKLNLNLKDLENSIEEIDITLMRQDWVKEINNLITGLENGAGSEDKALAVLAALKQYSIQIKNDKRASAMKDSKYFIDNNRKYMKDYLAKVNLEKQNQAQNQRSSQPKALSSNVQRKTDVKSEAAVKPKNANTNNASAVQEAQVLPSANEVEIKANELQFQEVVVVNALHELPKKLDSPSISNSNKKKQKK